MFKKLFQPIGQKQGFTLVEMIGVLAIIAILIALLLPKVFTLIASTNSRSLAAAIRTYETAIVNYYADIGSVYPLNAVLFWSFHDFAVCHNFVFCFCI